jgi:hypothetical protein
MDPNEIAKNLVELRNTTALKTATIELNNVDVDLFQAFLDNPDNGTAYRNMMLFAHPNSRTADKNPEHVYAISAFRDDASVQPEVRQQIKQINQPKPDPAPTPPQPTPSKPDFAEAFKNVGAAAKEGQTSGTSVPIPTNSKPPAMTTQYIGLYQSPSTYSALSSNDLRLDLQITVEALANLVNSYIATSQPSATLGITGPLPTTKQALTQAAEIIAQALQSLKDRGVQVTISEPLLTELRAKATENPAVKNLITQYDEPLSPRTPRPSHAP